MMSYADRKAKMSGGRQVIRVMALNQLLYSNLTQRIGPVMIGNKGERATAAAPVYNASTNQYRENFGHFGEYYRVNCPYCGDTRQRLYVNHRWCTPDSLTGEPMHHLAVCFNADCLKSHYRSFQEQVFAWENASTREIREAMSLMTVDEGKDDSGPLEEVTLPGECTPIDQLERSHEAVVYLKDRGFDPVELYAEFGIVYCHSVFGPFSVASRRIIIPIYFEGVLVGWQARYVGECNWKKAGIQKYYNRVNFKKRRVLYNYDAALKGSPEICVVVEGVTDVWKGGVGFVASLGKSVSPSQRILLASWASKGGVLAWVGDPGALTTEIKEATEEATLAARERARIKHEALLAELRDDFRNRVVEVQLPDERDPGKFERDELRKLVFRAVKKSGLVLDKSWVVK